MRTTDILAIMAAVAFTVWSCGKERDPGFGSGGSGIDPGDSGGSGGGGGDTADTADTAADTADTADDTGDTGTPDLEGTGYEEGDVAYELSANTQTGSPWSLHGMYGTRVVLVVGNMYNASMVEVMGYLDALESDNTGLVAAALVGLDEYSELADQSDAASWAIDYGVTVVMYDPALETWYDWAQSQQLRLYLIDDDMTIAWTNNGATTQSELQTHIDDL